MVYWLGVLGAQIPTVVEKAMASEGATSGAPCLQTRRFSVQEPSRGC